MSEKLNKYLQGELVSSIFYIVLGLCLVCVPAQTVYVICKVILGLLLIIVGCYHVMLYLLEKKNATILDLFTGVVVIVIGGFLFTNPQVVVKLLPLILGGFLLADNVWSIRGAVRLKARTFWEWKVLLAGSIIFIILGIVVLISPFQTVTMIMVFAGWVLLGDGVLDLIFLLLLRRGMKKELILTDNDRDEAWEGEKEKSPEEGSAKGSSDAGNSVIKDSADRNDRDEKEEDSEKQEDSKKQEDSEKQDETEAGMGGTKSFFQGLLNRIKKGPDGPEGGEEETAENTEVTFSPVRTPEPAVLHASQADSSTESEGSTDSEPGKEKPEAGEKNLSVSSESPGTFSDAESGGPAEPETESTSAEDKNPGAEAADKTEIPEEEVLEEWKD
ncbi:MAG: DUF308 domain-containing protein [Clostridiales bacterium]|nr:DUF308 domain-containing protein [Clostridiales bacterium]